MTRWPLFGEREADELPWDVVAAIRNFKFKSYVSRRLDMEHEYPHPTPRSKASPAGMSAWEKFCSEERRLSQTPGYEKPFDRYSLVVPGAYLAFDHKIWSESAELVYFDRDTVRAYTLHEIPVVKRNYAAVGPDDGVAEYDVMGG